jgi:hypothetical protein
MGAVIVREYKSQQAFEKDANELAALGYAVHSVVNQQAKGPGCLGILTTGLLAFRGRKSLLIVTYKRSEGASPTA